VTGPIATTKLRHGRIELALHTLRAAGDGSRPLLLLHGVAERSPTVVPAELESWPGPVHALDFTGHGESTVPRGGGYTAEVLMGDADTALRHLGEACVLGRGLGAYVALLLAGARPGKVRGAILCDGPGLAGGGPRPGTPFVIDLAPAPKGPPDPWAIYEFSRDLRPPDYATSFVRLATQLSGLDRPLTVCCVERPPWLAEVVEEPGVEGVRLRQALVYYGQGAGQA